jgi:hypothetical protein
VTHRLATAEVAGRTFTQIFREPGFMLDFFVQNRQRDIASPVVFSKRQIADLGERESGFEMVPVFDAGAPHLLVRQLASQLCPW